MPVFIMSYGPAALCASELSLIPAIWSQRAGQTAGSTSIDAVYLPTEYQFEIICVELRNFYHFITLTGFFVLFIAVVPAR